ncbi:DUF4097 family beta strand repeat-containing protein [Deinococcus marmoris]|uniref:Cell wall-active antibiotics response LiaF-like C-terminal domain-containing protein n=1 Tax=Deinococcus marmoris TaxID=249408 RepID=A0A1U7NST6_9DEIO|nr:DUF4097 family beta strand repeat-containing protein [Deinococcus marmoris]OLV15988.1 hypothetical protein BOO71_0013330 [Deinococcus marmoris]
MKRNTPALIAPALMALATASFALAASYSSVNITLKQELGDLTLAGSSSASPVMGVRNPTIKNGVAYVSASHSLGDWAIGLSPKLPISLTVQASQGESSLDLRALKLLGLQVTQELGNLQLKLPAANLKATLQQAQGDTTITLPPNTGISLEVRKFTQGTLVMNGKKVADGQDFNGTYQSANFATAKYRVNLTVTVGQGNLTVK